MKLDAISLTQREVFKQLRENGVGANLHYIPVHTQPYYKRLGFSQGQFPMAEIYYNEAVSIPLFSGMTNLLQDEVVKVLTNILAK